MAETTGPGLLEARRLSLLSCVFFCGGKYSKWGQVKVPNSTVRRMLGEYNTFLSAQAKETEPTVAFWSKSSREGRSSQFAGPIGLLIEAADELGEDIIQPWGLLRVWERRRRGGGGGLFLY